MQKSRHLYFENLLSESSASHSAGLIEANQKLRDRVASLMQETQYKDAVNRALKAEVTRMISSGASPGESFLLDAAEDGAMPNESVNRTMKQLQSFRERQDNCVEGEDAIRSVINGLMGTVLLVLCQLDAGESAHSICCPVKR